MGKLTTIAKAALVVLLLFVAGMVPVRLGEAARLEEMRRHVEKVEEQRQAALDEIRKVENAELERLGLD